jgi:hypothetical protein
VRQFPCRQQAKGPRRLASTNREPRKDLTRLYQHPEPAASARWLLEHVLGDAQGYMVTFTGRQARLESRPDARPNELTWTRQRYFLYPEMAGEASNYLAGEARAGRDAYFGVHLYRESGNRLASNAVDYVHCLWLDLDDGDYPDEGPEPTACVRSSADRWQLYWKLSRRIPIDYAVTLNRRIAAWSGGDSGKAGRASVLRVPGTMNFKRHPQVDPVVGELTGVGVWEPEVMEEAIPPLPDSFARHKKARHREAYDGPEVDLLHCLETAGIEILGETPDSGGLKLAIVCPWIHEHSGADRTGTYAGQYDSGALWFYCHHEHCQGRSWREFKRAALRSRRFTAKPEPSYVGPAITVEVRYE